MNRLKVEIIKGIQAQYPKELAGTIANSMARELTSNKNSKGNMTDTNAHHIKARVIGLLKARKLASEGKVKKLLAMTYMREAATLKNEHFDNIIDALNALIQHLLSQYKLLKQSRQTATV